MGKRVFVKGKQTFAKGQDFELRRKDRYMINVSLVSLKTQKDYDLITKTGEFYFKVGGGVRYVRAPNNGYIQIYEFQDFEPGQNDFSIYTEFLTLKHGEEREKTIRVRLFERDVGKKDDLVFDHKLPIKLRASETEYVILETEDGLTKAKFRVRSTQTKH